MICLNSQLCEELDLTFWQLADTKPTETSPQYQLSNDESELLKNILLAKSIQLTASMIEILENGVVRVNLLKHVLLFNDASIEDTSNTVNLAKLSDMLEDKQQKKITWFKLKNCDLSY